MRDSHLQCYFSKRKDVYGNTVLHSVLEKGTPSQFTRTDITTGKEQKFGEEVE